MRSLLRPLWGSVVLFILGAVAVWFSLIRQAHDEELANAVSESRIANDASVDHTVHVVRQTDVLLRAVRAHYRLRLCAQGAGRFPISGSLSHCPLCP